MSEPFLAEIRMVGFNFAQRGFAFCNGEILPINQNQSLYSLLGTTYGGDGRTTFGLPDLRGRTPIHPDGTKPLGNRGGEENHVLNPGELPQHKHSIEASGDQATTNVPGGSVLAAKPRRTSPYYTAPTSTSTVPMHGNTIGHSGGGQGHNNMQPYLAVNFIIALQGLFPSRN